MGEALAKRLCGCFYADLIDEVLAVVIAQILRADNSVQIRLHQLLNKINFFEVFERRGLNYVENTDDLRSESCHPYVQPEVQICRPTLSLT